MSSKIIIISSHASADQASVMLAAFSKSFWTLMLTHKKKNLITVQT